MSGSGHRNSAVRRAPARRPAGLPGAALPACVRPGRRHGRHWPSPGTEGAGRLGTAASLARRHHARLRRRLGSRRASALKLRHDRHRRPLVPRPTAARTGQEITCRTSTSATADTCSVSRRASARRGSPGAAQAAPNAEIRPWTATETALPSPDTAGQYLRDPGGPRRKKDFRFQGELVKLINFAGGRMPRTTGGY